MLVRELIEQLSKLDGRLQVFDTNGHSIIGVSLSEVGDEDPSDNEIFAYVEAHF